jgi:adenine-specific DNA-methyltransferase
VVRKKKDWVKFRPLYQRKNIAQLRSYKYLVSPDTASARFASKEQKENSAEIPHGWRLAQLSFAVFGDPGKPEERIYRFRGKDYDCGAHRHWKTTNPSGLDSLRRADRFIGLGTQLNYIRYFDDFSVEAYSTQWLDTGSAGFSASDPKIYVVQTDAVVIERCLLMTTDPGDLVLDPTCGSGTTAYVASAARARANDLWR